MNFAMPQVPQAAQTSQAPEAALAALPVILPPTVCDFPLHGTSSPDDSSFRIQFSKPVKSVDVGVDNHRAIQYIGIDQFDGKKREVDGNETNCTLVKQAFLCSGVGDFHLVGPSNVVITTMGGKLDGFSINSEWGEPLKDKLARSFCVELSPSLSKENLLAHSHYVIIYGFYGTISDPEGKSAITSLGVVGMVGTP